MKVELCSRVLRGLNFLPTTSPSPPKFKPALHPHEFEKSYPLPPHTRQLL